MKFLSFLSIVLFGLMLSVSACGGESDAKAKARESIQNVQAPAPATTPQQPSTANTPPPPPRPAEPAQNTKGVWHYTCSEGCSGGGGAATDKCGTCGRALAHNALYHQ